jgi:hypothetical protein
MFGVTAREEYAQEEKVQIPDKEYKGVVATTGFEPVT